MLTPPNACYIIPLIKPIVTTQAATYNEREELSTMKTFYVVIHHYNSNNYSRYLVKAYTQIEAENNVKAYAVMWKDDKIIRIVEVDTTLTFIEL